ncbi:MAG TPA: Ig-like domain-containing protein, partial [Prolixibacteraceae bacterium]|nr:Ig-like domain-containing protein [Prolixibacteraceae bacterium]
ILSCSPVPFETNFSGKDIAITFDEYVVADKLNEEMIVSPPLGKKPTVSTKGKTLLIRFEEELIKDRTYSFDFGEAIKDYNEGNKYPRLRLVFSTGSQRDSLQISGYIYNAQTLEPEANALATLYSTDNDSLFKTLKPDFIARTDEKGFFLFDNLPAGNFKLFGIKDSDRNYFFSNSSEQIAFCDSTLTPTVSFVEKIDTILTENDTIISKGYVEYMPQNIQLLLFEDDFYSQYLSAFKRVSADQCIFTFNEPVSDSIEISLIDTQGAANNFEVEYSAKRDTISLWFTDSINCKKDTVFLSITYMASDTLNSMSSKTDTLRMIAPKKPATKVKTDSIQYFNLLTNIGSSAFDLNKTLSIEAPSPIESIGPNVFKLMQAVNDSVNEAVTFSLKKDENSSRKYSLLFDLKPDTKYLLEVDSGMIKTYSGLYNAGFSTKFETQKKDYYGSLVINMQNANGPGILRLVKNDKTETIIKELIVKDLSKSITLGFLSPGNYLVKYIEDS